MQIWIKPNVSEIPPSYEQKSIPAIDKQGKLCLIASTDGASNAVKIHADAKVYVGLFDGPQSQTLTLDPRRKAYVHLVKGQLHVNGILLSAGDALLVENESSLLMGAGKDSEVLVFDLSQD